MLTGALYCMAEPVAGFPPSPLDSYDADRIPSDAPTRTGMLHNLCAIPVFVGIPVAAVICATSAAWRGQYRWAAYSAGAAIAMTSASALFGAGFGGAPPLARWGGALQSISVTTGFGWLSALSLRALTPVLAIS